MSNYIPYSRQNICESDIEAVLAVLRSEYLTQGPVIPAFEEAFAQLHQASHAIAVSSATAALHLACLALGVKPGGIVWTTPNTFLATANCALYCGAEVDFVDIDPVTRNICVASLQAKLEKAQMTHSLPDVVIPVDFAGLPSDLKEIRQLASAFGFKIIEDASHAIGASYQGHPVGSRYADITVFSLHAVKIVTTGEGGILTTQDPNLAHRLRLLRSHGMTRDSRDMQRVPEGGWYYEQIALGYNYRMTEMQAALGLSQLTRVKEMHAARKRLADRYDLLLGDLPLILPVRLPDRESAWHLYSVEIDSSRTSATRSCVFEKMRSSNIGVNVHYIPVHVQPYYEKLGFKPIDFPKSVRYYERAISIPLFPQLTSNEQDRVVRSMKTALISR